jgi:hypothetical protein
MNVEKVVEPELVGETKNTHKKLPQYHFVLHRSHMT